MSEPKPCPYCGSDLVEVMCAGSNWFADCRNCGANGSMIEDGVKDDYDKALEAWNRVASLVEWQREYELSLNRRVKVESEMLECVSGKRPMPDADKLREWAATLGVPAEWLARRK
jgi:Lar family restriction alleviation protein